MTANDYDITTSYWDEDSFDCSSTKEGRRVMNEVSRRIQGEFGDGNDFDIISIDEAESEYNLDIVGTGVTRVVVKPNDSWVVGDTECVVKIQWDRTHHQTANEIHVWENVNGRQAALLSPILDSSEYMNWVIMPEATDMRGMTAKEAGKMVRGLRHKMTEVGLQDNDIRRGNVGIVNGRGVLIDFGTTSII